MPLQVFYILILSLVPFLGMSHGDLDERIKATTAALELTPNDATLLLKRAKLFYQHGEYMRSIRDYEKAEIHQGSIKIILQGYAQAWLKVGQNDFALESIDSLISLAPTYHKAHDIKAEILMNQKRYQEAAKSYRRTIDLTIEKQTPLYHNLVSAYDSIGTATANYNSIEVIKEALSELGPITTMQVKLVDLLMEVNMYEEAILNQSEIIASSNRKERQYLKRAKIYFELQDEESAQKDLLSSIENIKSLPIRIRKSKKMNELMSEIEKLQN